MIAMGNPIMGGQDSVSQVHAMGLNLIWLGTIWGAAVGIILADILYFLTDSLLSFLLFIPCAAIGFYLGRKTLRKWGSTEEFIHCRK